MSTSYDKIWKTFLDNCKTPDINIPQTDEQIYAKINNGILLFNNRMRTNIKCDDLTESVDTELNDDQLLILANFIKLVFYKNEKTYYETLLNPFQKDIGLRNFSTQINSLNNSVTEQERYIERLIINQAEDFL